jgi:hypothetical protein
MFQWNTAGAAKWYLGQRSSTGTDSFSLYNVATGMDAMHFSDIGNVTFRNDVIANYYYGNGVGLTGTAASLNIGGTAARTNFINTDSRLVWGESGMHINIVNATGSCQVLTKLQMGIGGIL